MIVRGTSSRAYEFACHSAACAPPPAGRGGSMKGGSIKGVGQGSVKVSSLKSGDRVVFAQKARTVSSVGVQKNGKVGISFKDGGITDMPGSSSLPRPSKKVRVPAGAAAKFVKAPNPDKKWAMNPNNPKNQQRHPDSDRASKKIIRTKTRG